jgi:hypothetical protein
MWGSRSCGWVTGILVWLATNNPLEGPIGVLFLLARAQSFSVFNEALGLLGVVALCIGFGCHGRYALPCCWRRNVSAAAISFRSEAHDASVTANPIGPDSNVSNTMATTPSGDAATEEAVTVTVRICLVSPLPPSAIGDRRLRGWRRAGICSAPPCRSRGGWRDEHCGERRA